MSKRNPYGIGPLADSVQAAECCTEIGADDDPLDDNGIGMIGGLIASVALVAFVAWVVFKLI